MNISNHPNADPKNHNIQTSWQHGLSQGYQYKRAPFPHSFSHSPPLIEVYDPETFEYCLNSFPLPSRAPKTHLLIQVAEFATFSYSKVELSAAMRNVNSTPELNKKKLQKISQENIKKSLEGYSVYGGIVLPSKEKHIIRLSSSSLPSRVRPALAEPGTVHFPPSIQELRRQHQTQRICRARTCCGVPLVPQRQRSTWEVLSSPWQT
jgi:hypothetical protein